MIANSFYTSSNANYADLITRKVCNCYVTTGISLLVSLFTIGYLIFYTLNYSTSNGNEKLFFMILSYSAFGVSGLATL